MTESHDISPRLDEALRQLGDDYGPLGVALAAAHLTDPDVLIAQLAGDGSTSQEPIPAPETYWNYRVVQTVDHGEELWGIYEVHYSDDRPTARTVNPITFISEVGPEGVADSLRAALRATEAPVLTDADFGIH